MYWTIPEIPDTLAQPAKRTWGRPAVWIIALAICCCISLIWIFWLKGGVWYSLLFPGILLAAFIYRFIVSIHKGTAEEAWELEKKKIHNKWIEWAAKKVALTDVYVGLPEGISLRDVVCQEKDAYRFDCVSFNRKDDISDTVAFADDEVEKNISEKLFALRDYSEKITVHLHASDEYVYEYWQNKLAEMAEDVGMGKSGWSVLPLQKPEELIDEWFDKNGSEGIHAVLSVWLNRDVDEAEFTETVTWLVFSPPHLARRTKLPVRAWLQRPVSFDEGKRSQALKHYTNYGLNGDAVDAIWFLASREDTQKYMGDIQNAGGRLHSERDKFLLHTPSLYMGAMASGNSLFLLGLAAENTAQKHQLFGWETDSGFYLGRLSQAVGLN